MWMQRGAGKILKEEHTKNVVEVKSVSDRAMSVKMEIESMMINVVGGLLSDGGERNS